MKLSIIIPYNNEPLSVIEPNLQMINQQQCVNMFEYELIIVSDQPTCKIDKKYIDKFTNIKHTNIVIKPKSHTGPGTSRQIGMEHALSKWVVFIDADDIITNNLFFYAFEYEVYNSNYKVVETLRYEERNDSITTEEPDKSFLHGMIFNKKFVNNVGVKFHPELKVQEDVYFIRSLRLHTEFIQWNFPFYLWKRRPNSITRKNNHEYKYTSIPAYIRAIDLVNEQDTHRTYLQHARPQIEYWRYITIHNEFQSIPKQYQDDTFKMLSYFFNKYPEYKEYQTEVMQDWVYQIQQLGINQLPKYHQPI